MRSGAARGAGSFEGEAMIAPAAANREALEDHQTVALGAAAHRELLAPAQALGEEYRMLEGDCRLGHQGAVNAPAPSG